LGVPPFPKNKNNKVLVHIGCGEIASPEFINIDVRPYPHVHYITDKITELSMFSNNSVDLIYISHILEHFAISDIRPIIWEMKRVLRHNGILRISVPDFDRLIQVYVSHNNDINCINGYLMGAQNHPYNFHYSIFNRKYLMDLLLASGFTTVREWDPMNCDYHAFEDCSTTYIDGDDGKKYFISLNLEAIK
jgi:predicted SAM-dependent methyltransferase